MAMSKRLFATDNIHRQLELIGLEQLRGATSDRRQIARLEAASRVLSEDFADQASIAFTHGAFCMTGLPHSRPASNEAPWHRVNGAMHLLVEPGSVIENGHPRKVGVPYGPKARLILIYIQTHARPDGVVPLGKTLSNWIRRLGFDVTGGQRGTIGPVKEQVLRLARARISLHWTNDKGNSAAIVDRTPVDGLTLWAGDPLKEGWHDELHLSPEFINHLERHKVPLADAAISHLKGRAWDWICTAGSSTGCIVQFPPTAH